MADEAGSCVLPKLGLRAVRSCVLPRPTGTAPRKLPQESELDSTSLQAVSPGHGLLFLLSAWLLGRLSLVFLYSCCISVQEEIGVLGICSHRPEVSTQAGYPSANPSQCPDQVTACQSKGNFPVSASNDITAAYQSKGNLLCFWFRLTV